VIDPLNAELNTICHLLALLRAHHIFHVSRIRVKRIKFKIIIALLGVGLPTSAEFLKSGFHI
jgi:hypothetical protein